MLNFSFDTSLNAPYTRAQIQQASKGRRAWLVLGGENSISVPQQVH